MQRHRVVKGEKFSVAGTVAGGKGGTGQAAVQRGSRAQVTTQGFTR